MNSVSKSLLSGIAFASNASSLWTDLQERFDRVDRSRTYSLHKEIATLQQRTAFVSIYHTRLKALWDDFEVLVPSPCYNCEKSRGFVAHMNRQKMYQFLIGLNDTYHQARSQILMIDPLPIINQAYSIIVEDESQKAVVTGINNLGLYASNSDSVAMYLRVRNSSGISNRFKKNTSLICDFCKCRGHTKDSFYKVVGYAPDFKSKRKVQSANMVHADTNSLTNQSQQSGQANFSYSLNTNVTDEALWGRNSTVHQTTNKPPATTSNKTAKKEVKQLLQGCTFTKDQYEQFFMMMNQQSGSRANAPDCNKGNNVGKALFVTENSDVWIVDTGATNHMVSKLEMLLKESVLQLNTPKDVCLPNGEFKYNLMSVSKITKELGCSVSFFPDLCVFQELYTGKVKEVDKKSDMELWHKRLGHVSSAVLAKMFTMNKYTKNQFGKVVKVLRSDNGTEFVNSVCDSMFKALGMFILEKPYFHFAKNDSSTTQQLFVDNLQGLGETAPQLQLSPFIISGTAPFVISEEATCGHPDAGEQDCVSTQTHTDTSGTDVSGPPITRRSVRSKHPPIWMKDFVSLNVKQDIQYPLSNYVIYSHLSPSHQCFIAATSSMIEPTNYAEAVKHPIWVEAT
ncbi:uncharacterized protein LOC129872909 [Solanum dulcamara]|uniref:uncharacterized protein LOC129872909 n=1 Tax=Solanum dulcamara TaxID=45834 RepID=UPI002486C7A5|nr:uncharacterized protein LOC129872909 [Solanum dulcamara]